MSDKDQFIHKLVACIVSHKSKIDHECDIKKCVFGDDGSCIMLNHLKKSSNRYFIEALDAIGNYGAHESIARHLKENGQ